MRKDQIVALLQANRDNDAERFRAVSLQIAADASRRGQEEFARRVEQLAQAPLRPVSLSQAAQEVLYEKSPSHGFSELVLDDYVLKPLTHWVEEWKARERLRERGLDARRRLLFLGPPGTGKTATAGALARALDLPLYVARLDAVIDSYMGNTGKNLRKVFDAVRSAQGVYLLDEFDALASRRVGRTGESDVAEMRRALNLLLQYLEEEGAGIVVAATNLEALLDEAVFRRFDLVLEFRMPTEEEVRVLIWRTLDQSGIVLDDLLQWNLIREDVVGRSQANAVRVAKDLARKLVLEGHKPERPLARPAAP